MSFLGIYQNLFITLPPSTCLFLFVFSVTSYYSPHPGLSLFAWPLPSALPLSDLLLHVHFNPINTFFPFHAFPVNVFSHLFFTAPSLSFPPPFTHLPAAAAAQPSPHFYWSPSLGSIKASAAPQRMTESLWHLRRGRIRWEVWWNGANMGWKWREQVN